MVIHFKRIIAISALLFILLMTISGSFAHENQTDLGEEESVCYLSESVDIYFDASAADDGDGSRQNPYNTIDSSKLKNNSNIYFEDGDYILESEELNLENVNIFGKNPEKRPGKQLACIVSLVLFISMATVTPSSLVENTSGQVRIKSTSPYALSCTAQYYRSDSRAHYHTNRHFQNKTECCLRLSPRCYSVLPLSGRPDEM